MSNDVPQLALTQAGESVNDIHVNGILNTFKVTPIYSHFSDFMDGLDGPDGLINEWLPFAYDWRFSPEKIIEDGIKTKTGVIDIMDKLNPCTRF